MDISELIREVLRELRPVAAPALILISVSLLMIAGPGLPPSLSGLTPLGPYLLLGLAAAISAWFNRGRAFIAAATLLGACAAYGLAYASVAGQLGGRAVFVAITLLVPLNVAAALVYPERGLFHRSSYRWLPVAIAQVLIVAWIAGAARAGPPGAQWLGMLDHWLFRAPPMPVAGRLMFVVAFALALMRAWPKPPAVTPLPLDAGLVGALVAFFVACEWAAAPGAFSAFLSAAGMILLVALLQESHRLAFRDELTGLPGRRSLEERLRGLAPAYALAMVDVDHFKQFNDTHGHDIGDQVLKLVAARLAGIGGGGSAYRYGGEEFVVVFPGRGASGALPDMEGMRISIASYRMAVRSPDRPRDIKTGAAMRQTRTADKTLSVTVSIGVAEPNGTRATPAAVMRAADQALYRAKGAGRNRVSL